MGGNALKKHGIFTERKTTEEFQRIADEIQKQVAIDFNNKIDTSIVTCYHNKPTHGDLDILVKTIDGFNINFKNYIEDTFKPRAIHVNDGVYSFDYDNFQIDFNLIPEKYFKTANVYYSYDPIGNIMGKVYHKFGLSYGWKGLSYKFRNFNGRLTQDIIVSTDTRKIFEFAGYDYDRYLKGFDDLEDIFEFVINNPYFDTEVFQFNNLNRIDRKRNLRRHSYHLFLNYLNENNINYRYDFKNKEDYLYDIDDYFPESKLLNKIDSLYELDSRNQIIANKFNGDLIMSWINDLTGKELGIKINEFKTELGDDFEWFILNSDEDTIRREFIKFYNNEFE
ncbi:MAG: hypothetical protein ACOC2W_01000 [bacterium]